MADKNVQQKSRKPLLLLKQEELLAEEFKKYPCLYNEPDKSYKESDTIKNAWESVSSAQEFVDDGMFRYYSFY